MASAEPSTIRAPASTPVWPLKVLVPERISVPSPTLPKSPAPAPVTGPERVKVTPASTLMNGLPARVMTRAEAKEAVASSVETEMKFRCPEVSPRLLSAETASVPFSRLVPPL